LERARTAQDSAWQRRPTLCWCCVCTDPSLRRTASRPLLDEVRQHSLDAAVHIRLLRHAQLGEDRVDVLLDRPICERECCRDAGIVATLRKQRQNLALAWSQLGERRRRRATPRSAEQFYQSGVVPGHTTRHPYH